jgi:hypothetical protein
VREEVLEIGPVMSDRFGKLVRKLPAGNEKDSIIAALYSSAVSNEDELRVIIYGMMIAEVTSLFERSLKLDEFAASALAGLLVPGW